MLDQSVKHPYLIAIGSLIGTTIGVGMFGIPYVAAQAGIGITIFYLLFFGAITILTHAMYMEVVLRTKGHHRLVGYTNIYLGKTWKWIIFFETIVALWGAILLYTVIGGQFLSIVLGGAFSNTETITSLLFFAIASIVIIKGIRTIGIIELIFSILLIIVVFLFFGRGILADQIDTSNFFLANWAQVLLPFGMVLFALNGLSIIPSLKNEVLYNIKKGEKINFGKIVTIGIGIPIIVFIVFSIAIVGITGNLTSPNTLTGLEQVIGNGYVKLGALIGIFALFTSFIALGNELKRTFLVDLKFSPSLSILGALAVPLVLFLLGLNNFITIASFLGIFSALIIHLAIFIMHKKAKTKGAIKNPLLSFKVPAPVLWISVIIFVIGFVVSIVNLI